jgi:hypothetical protein
VIEFFQNVPWHQVGDFLANGNPPLVIRILILNTLFFVIFAYRRARGVPAMREKTAFRVQTFLIAANALILFEPEIETTLSYFHRLI